MSHNNAELVAGTPEGLVHWRIMNGALLIIDVQKDYFPNGRMELEGSVEAAKRIEHVIGKARTANMPIIYIQHIASKKDASFFIDGTDGIDIYS